MSRRSVGWFPLLAACAMSAVGCRDATAPYVPPDAPPSSDALRRLTFSPGDDREPAWSAGGDTVFYTAEGFGDLPSTDALLVGVASIGGVAWPMLPGVQGGAAQRRLLTADISPDGSRAAYVQVIALHADGICPGAGSACETTASDGPPVLDRVAVRVREMASLEPATDDPLRAIAFEGRFFDTSQPSPGVTGTWIVLNHPFQIEFNEEGVLPVRPSWAPTGDRVVFSDGLRLFIWNLSIGTETVIPGSDDAVLPAWSPDGAWIAFTRLARGPAGTQTCQWFAPGKDGVPLLQCVEERTKWPFYVREIWVMRTDGSEARRLTEGTQPAWTPDAAALYFVRDGQIWRVLATGGEPVPVPGTVGGVDPAVSPDGTELAFARRAQGEPHDVWILSLDVEE
jgi:hypothetical protein